MMQCTLQMVDDEFVTFGLTTLQTTIEVKNFLQENLVNRDRKRVIPQRRRFKRTFFCVSLAQQPTK
jgi:hypothetical protein